MRTMKWISGLALIVVLGIAAPPASAASMDATCDTFQDALDQASSGNVITLTEDCTYTGDDNFTMPFKLPSNDGSAPITVQGDVGGGAPATLDGDDSVQLMLGDDTGNLIIRNLTFSNGCASGDCQDDGYDGGAIGVTGASPVTIGDHASFYGNYADGNGGAVYVRNTDPDHPVTVVDSVFGSSTKGQGNQAPNGSGGGVYINSAGPIVVGDKAGAEPTGNVFANNSASDFGGGLAIVQNDVNRAARGLNTVNQGPITVEDSTFTKNVAQSSNGGGGGVSITDAATNGDVALRRNTFGAEDAEGVFDGNRANQGGGADVQAQSVQIEATANRFFGNTASQSGGGLSLFSAARQTVAQNVFRANTADIEGGGALLAACSGAALDSNVFDSNVIDLGNLDNIAKSRVAIGSPQYGAGLKADQSACYQGLQALARGDGGPQLVQTGNRFRSNQITGQSFGDEERAGGGEYVRTLTVRSTDDRFVGNVLVPFGAPSRGAGYAQDGSSQTTLLDARNLVAAGNRIEEPPSNDVRGGDGTPSGRGGGLAVLGQSSTFRITDSTIEGNVAAEGSGIAGQNTYPPETASRSATHTDSLVLHNSIVFHNTGHESRDIDGFAGDGEVDGFPNRDVRFSDVCVDKLPHADGDGSDPNSNICEDPLLTGPVGDENVDQTRESPTLDIGANGLVDGDLANDYAGDARIQDADNNGTATVDMGADEFPAPKVEPTPSPTPTPTPTATPTATPAATPAPQGAVLGATQRSCVSRRAFSIHIRVPHGKQARTATVFVNNKKVRVVRAARLKAPVILRGLPKGRFSVKIILRLTNGKRVTGVRRYHTCVPKLPDNGPPPV